MIVLAALLAENNRITDLGEISEMFDRLLSAERGEVPVSITTAEALTDAQRSDVLEAVGKFLKEGQVAVLNEKVSFCISVVVFSRYKSW